MQVVSVFAAPENTVSDPNRAAGKATADLGAIEAKVCQVHHPRDHPHHQQQTQQTFHVQLLRLAYPDATNIEVGAEACGQQPDPHRRQEGWQGLRIGRPDHCHDAGLHRGWQVRPLFDHAL